MVKQPWRYGRISDLYVLLPFVHAGGSKSHICWFAKVSIGLAKAQFSYKKDLYSLYKYNIMLTLKFYINARHYMRAYNCFYYGFHPLVFKLLLSCFVAFLLCCCSKLKHRRNGQRIVRVVYATELKHCHEWNGQGIVGVFYETIIIRSSLICYSHTSFNIHE